jgi:CheY-like chemotaxis protein
MVLALVVEDDADLLALLGRHLERLGCEVLLASNGRRAIELALQRPPDLAVVDILLPDMDGHAVIFELRELHSGHGCVVVTTSVLDASDIGGDADAVLPKPFGRADVERIVGPLIAMIGERG